MVSRSIYRAVLWLLLPYILFHLLWRARKQPAYLEHWSERFGFCRVQISKPVIWLHTVSVGETRAVVTLVRKLQEAYPGHQLLLTHTTPTGREESERLYGNDVLRVYLPYDYPSAVRRFLHRFRPVIGVLMETEIWPSLIHACNLEKIPLLLLNARMSEKSARRYARYPNLTRATLCELNIIAAQTEADARRLKELGAPSVSVMGNLKFDIEPPLAMIELGRQLRYLFGTDRKVFLAASTRPGEEALVMDAFAQANVPNLLVVIVPRHPQRFDEVAELLARRNISFQRKSEGRAVSKETQVVLGDSMGEMFAYYAACDVAFIGGSLLPFGGQNLIEACALGKPVLLGPYTYNFSEASELAVASGAALRIEDKADLVRALPELMQDLARIEKMGLAASSFAAANRGATNMALSHIAGLIQ